MAAKSGSFKEFLSEKRERLLPIKLSPELSFNDENRYGCHFCCSLSSISYTISNWIDSIQDMGCKMVELGRSDPRKVIFAAKMGFALMLVSLLIFLKEPDAPMSRYSVWGVLTVIVVFEFSIGATLSKGFNRFLGTFSAGGLALGMAELSSYAGEWSHIFVIISIFVIGFCATYIKLYPTMKPYEYGFRVFLLTYCIVMVSGYRTGEFIHTAVTRFLLIALGASVGLVVNICFFPIWAGEDLHNLVAKNFSGVATSLEGCVRDYLNCIEYARVPSKILTFEASDDPLYSGYRSAIESKSQEDTLMGFAIWEPPHGPYKKLHYPWKNYVKLSGALRYCAFAVMALHGCILSEIQAPPERRRILQSEIERVGTEGAKVLRVLGNKVKNMEKLGPLDILHEVKEAAEELQKKVDAKSYILVRSEAWEIGNRPKEVEQQPKVLHNLNYDDEDFHEFKSHSETLLDVRAFPKPRRLEGASSFQIRVGSLPGRNSVFASGLPEGGKEGDEEACKTYENASALSLATFTTLLMEFVARLQNLVTSYKELSERANFKEPVSLDSMVEDDSNRGNVFWSKMCWCLNLGKRQRTEKRFVLV